MLFTIIVSFTPLLTLLVDFISHQFECLEGPYLNFYLFLTAYFITVCQEMFGRVFDLFLHYLSRTTFRSVSPYLSRMNYLTLFIYFIGTHCTYFALNSDLVLCLIKVIYHFPFTSIKEILLC
jgi:hypothetical protein